MNDLQDIQDAEEVINIMQNIRNVKTYKIRKNPFEIYGELEFRQKYRFTKANVLFLDALFGDCLRKDRRGGGLPSILQILIALRCWGRNQIQDDAADIHGLTQQSVSSVCRQVTRAILERRNEYIKMPNTLEDQIISIRRFEAIAGFKNVIGAIDCTHIRVPTVAGPVGQYYINRKGYSSLNVQVISSANLKLLNIIARWRGSTHDSRIFNESRIKQTFESGRYHGRLLGDSGYACTPYLFTPVLHPETQRDQRYNYAHIRTRNCVERCFGVWKSRFRCLLTGFRTKLCTNKMTIVALAVLHNIAIELQEETFPEDVDVPLFPQPPAAYPQQNTLRGAAVRATFITQNF